MKETHETLGNNVVPLNYSITFEPNMKSFRFLGHERIEVKIARKTSAIDLNAKELRIRSAHVESSGRSLKARVKRKEKAGRISLLFGERIAGNAVIEIKFEGRHNDGMYGFYRSSYTFKKRTLYSLTTQFEASNARAAFPCFDEPEFKATYDISLVIDKDLDAISNTEIKSTVKVDGKKKMVTFERTPKMSSYLLYMGVGRYEYINGRLGKLRIRIVTRPGKSQLGSLAMDYAKKFIAFYERYFGVSYPLKKADFIAVPDFAAGAMENWGAITFREVLLLSDKDNASVAAKQRVAEVIAHELTHQWFGDLVTMRWWDDLWLNESFATFMAYKAVDSTFPKWRMMDQYLNIEASSAFAADQLMSTHPINMVVKDSSQIDSMFDSISYEKGGTVLRMLEDYAGQEVFRRGLHRYLKENAYSNATKYDLWGSIEREARARGKPVPFSRVAKAWIDKPGYPLVKVYKSDFAVHLSQGRYTVLGSSPNAENVWPVPVRYKTSRGAEGFLLFDKTDQDIATGQVDWIKINSGAAGFYRTQYQTELLPRLGEAISSGRLGYIDAWGVENDLFAMARSARMAASEYLDFITRYCMDAEPLVSESISHHLSWLYHMSYGMRLSARVATVSREFHLRLLGKLGWNKRPGEGNIESMLRSSSAHILSMLGHKPTIKRFNEMYKKYRKDRKLVDPDMKAAMLGSVAWNGGGNEFNWVLNAYLREEIPEERVQLLSTLGAFRREDLAKRALQLPLSKKVRLQDSYLIPEVVSENPATGQILLAWTMSNWKRIRSSYDSGTLMLGRYVRNMEFVHDEQTMEVVRKFFSDRRNRREDIERDIGRTMEIIEANVNFTKKNE